MTDAGQSLEPTARLNHALTGRYRIEREIGRGGMATVYLAHDVKHERHVALKVLDAELGVAVGTKRFLAEIRVTANLQHPNVLPLFDSGEAGGSLFYVMPFVAGESLRARILREKQLPIDESIRIATAVAHALDYAHRHGVVHRDIKPENILLSEGVPMVADFGIAKALAATRDSKPTSGAVTALGISLGTPAYMSPEQAMGDAEVDGRSDVYALGCLLYEMLAGELPFSGPTAHSIIAQHLTTPVPSVRTARDAVPPVIDSAITRAMAKDASHRFATPAEFAAALVAAPPVEPKPDYSQITEPVTRTQEPIVGRRKEVADLMARLDAMENGKGGLALIGGEPGVGKTRLTEAVLLEGRRRGHFCVVGHCYEMEGGAPYLPFLEQLEYAARVAPPGRFRATLGNSASEISRIMPALRQMFPDVAPPLDLPPDQQRQFLFSRLREYLERSAKNVPIVMLFDDVHWADESTLLLLEHLAHHLPQLRILALATYRDVELDVGRPFAKSLERLARQRLADRITLRRMPESDVAELLAALGAPAPPAELVHAIYHETEGNPFFVEEVFQHLREEGRLLDADGRWLSELRIDELEVPEGVRLVIGRRLERAGDACRAVLTSAAVIGPRFDLKILEALGEADGDAILEALEKAEAAGLVISQAAGRETRYTFAHELIRQTLVGAMSLPRRQRRHQRTAEAIEKAFAGKLETKVSDLAYHLFQAGAAVETERTTRYLLLAGQQALAAGAFDEALSHVDRALSILESHGHRQHVDLLRVRAEALRGGGRWVEAIDAFYAALEGYEALAANAEVVVVALSVSDMLTWASTDTTRLAATLSRAVAANRDASPRTRSALMSRVGIVTVMNGDYDAGRAMCEEGLQIARTIGDEQFAAQSLGLRGALKTLAHRVTDSVPDLSDAYQTLSRLGSRWDAARFGSLLARLHFASGNPTASMALIADVRRAADEIGHVGAAWLADQQSGVIEWSRSPSLDALERFARRLNEVPHPVPLFREMAKSYLALARLERGEDPDPAQLLEGSAERAGHPSWRDVQWGNYFLIAAYSNPARARAAFAQYSERLPTVGSTPTFGGAMMAATMAVQGLAVLGERDLAAALYPQCLDLLRLGAVVEMDEVFECSAGIAAACGAQWDKADAHFVNALRTAMTVPHVPAQAEVRRWHAWMLLARGAQGDVERARPMLNEAIAINERIGLPRRVQLCRDLLA